MEKIIPEPLRLSPIEAQLMQMLGPKMVTGGGLSPAEALIVGRVMAKQIAAIGHLVRKISDEQNQIAAADDNTLNLRGVSSLPSRN